MVIMFNEEEGPEVILVALLDHGDDDDEEKRHEPRLRGDGRVNHPGEDQGHLEGKLHLKCSTFFRCSHQKVEISSSSKLLNYV